VAQSGSALAWGAYYIATGKILKLLIFMKTAQLNLGIISEKVSFFLRISHIVGVSNVFS